MIFDVPIQVVYESHYKDERRHLKVVLVRDQHKNFSISRCLQVFAIQQSLNCYPSLISVMPINESTTSSVGLIISLASSLEQWVQIAKNFRKKTTC
jgi:hypothetical protein